MLMRSADLPVHGSSYEVRYYGECSDESEPVSGGTTTYGRPKEASWSHSVTRRLKNEINAERRQKMTNQLDELTSLCQSMTHRMTSLCQSHDDVNTGTLDKTLVRYVTLRRRLDQTTTAMVLEMGRYIEIIAIYRRYRYSVMGKS